MKTFLSHLTQNEDKLKYKKCNQCKRRKPLYGRYICRVCYKLEILYKLSGNEFVYSLIRNSQINMEFIPHDKFKDIEYIAKFESYKAT